MEREVSFSLGGSGLDHAAPGTPRVPAKAGAVPAPDTSFGVGLRFVPAPWRDTVSLVGYPQDGLAINHVSGSTPAGYTILDGGSAVRRSRTSEASTSGHRHCALFGRSLTPCVSYLRRPNGAIFWTAPRPSGSVLRQRSKSLLQV